MKNMINDTLKEYERHFGEARHRENTGKFDTIFECLNKMDGALNFGKMVAAFIAFLCMAILGLLSYLATHRQQSVLLSQHPTTVASTAPQSSSMY